VDSLKALDLGRPIREADIRHSAFVFNRNGERDPATLAKRAVGRRPQEDHDGTDFNADAVFWNLDRYFKNDSPQFEIPRP
jgi:peptide/nickel transport system substrate-binding protein